MVMTDVNREMEMTKYNVVAISEATGEIMGVAEYDPTNDGRRDERVMAAAVQIASALGIAPPTQRINRAVRENGVEWGKMTGDLAVGMVEISFGRWGFNE